MNLKCYFDGANKPTPEHERVVLATACGTPGEWQGFNAHWEDMLEHFPAPPLHTKQAVSLNGDFSPDRGWDRHSVDDFISDAVKVIDTHIARPLPASGQYVSGLHVTTLTIPLDDWRRARKVLQLPNSINEILTSESLGFCFAWGRRIGAESYHLCFDQGEDFRGHAIDRISSKRIKEDVPIFNTVTVAAAGDSRRTPPLQMADLFAWCIAHNDQEPQRSWHLVLNDLPWRSLILDYSYLTQPNSEALERTLKWDTPRRGMQPKEPKGSSVST